MKEKPDYMDIVSKVKELSLEISLEPNDIFINITEELFTLQKTYLQNIEKYRVEQRKVTHDALEMLAQQIETGKQYIQRSYLKDFRERMTKENEEISDTLKKIQLE